MSWLTEGPLSRLGGDSAVAQGARAGAAAGPAGMAIGALAGWIAGRIQSGRLQSMVANNNAAFSGRQADRTDWSIGGPLGQFDSFGHGEPTRDDGNIGTDLGITDWSQSQPDDDGGPGAVEARRDGGSMGKGFAGDGWTGMSQGGDVHGMVIRGVQPGLGSGQKWYHGRNPGK